MKKQIGNVIIEAHEKGGRVYFTEIGRNPGQAIWDKQAGEWVKCHKEFGPRFRAQIKAAFGL